MDRKRTRFGSVAPAFVVLGLIVVGCGGGEGGEELPAADSTTSTLAVTTTGPPTTTSTVAPTTTTTLDDVGVLHSFIGYITDPTLTARADVLVEARSGDVVLTGEGYTEFAGSDGRFVLQIGDLPVHETLTLDDVDYERTGDGPWRVDVAASDPFAPDRAADPGSSFEDLELAAFLQTLGDLEHRGTILEGGEKLHRIGLPDGQNPDPLAFGLDSVEPGDLEVSFLAMSSGLPYEMILDLVEATESEDDLSMTMSIRFVEFGVPLVIEPPDDVWLTHHSEAEYSISHPENWDVENPTDSENPVDVIFLGLGGEELDIYVNEISPPGQVPLNGWLDTFRRGVEQEGGSSGEPTEFDLGGLPGRRMTFTNSDEFGPYAGVYALVQTDPERVYEFLLFGDTGEEVAIQALLDDFLSTFATD